VAATYRQRRQGSLAKVCPKLKGVLCEKPLSANPDDAWAFVDFCRARGILLQVNLWRRCDPFLAADWQQENSPRSSVNRQIVRGVYGNGLLNNGTHLVDLCRMLFGEVVGVRPARAPFSGPGGFPFSRRFLPVVRRKVEGAARSDVSPSRNAVSSNVEIS